MAENGPRVASILSLKEDCDLYLTDGPLSMVLRHKHGWLEAYIFVTDTERVLMKLTPAYPIQKEQAELITSTLTTLSQLFQLGAF